MLVSTVQKNEYGYVDLQIKNILFEVNEGTTPRHFRTDFKDDRNIIDWDWNNRFVFSESLHSLLKSCKLTNQNILIARHFAKESKKEYVDGSSESSQIEQSTIKVAADLEWNNNEGICPVKMDLKNDYLFPVSDRSFTTSFSPEANENLAAISNQDFSSLDARLDKYTGGCLDSVNSIRASANSGVPTTSRSISKESKMRISTDDDTHFDIFDLMKCSDDEVTDCSKSYCDKDDLTLNEDLVNKYEKNLGLDIVKDKNICWAAGNFDNEVCPLKNYDACNENSLMNFPREIPDDESRESFPEDWVFDENIGRVTEEQAPDPHIIVPKKTVDITKIKGWRKKQFTVEKCLANKNSLLKKRNVKGDVSEEDSQRNMETGQARDIVVSEEENNDYAFVCDKLDDFLNQEAELKINYEIPHLYAEYGIKLTSEEIVSRPKFKLSTIINKFPVHSVSQNILPQESRNVPFVSSDNTGSEEMQSSRISLIKKSNPKTKCAFPNKSHKNWSLWKENNLSKGKPMSLLKKELSVKKENITETSLPCRRSDRISQAALNKCNTSANSAVNESKIPFRDRACIEAAEGEVKAGTINKTILDFGDEYQFQIRKFGVVLYPGPSAPLNPFITYHLQKIRSYRTLIDKHWATFAVSAVVQKGKSETRKRMILPVSCCFKYKNENSPMLEENHCKVETNPLSECPIVDKDYASDINVGVSDKKFAADREEKLGMDDGTEIHNKEISETSEISKTRKISGKRRKSMGRLSVDSALTKKINEGKFDLYEEEIKYRDDLKDEVDMVKITSNDDNISDNMKDYSDDLDFYSEKCDIVFEKRRQKTSISNCIRENLRNSPEVIDIEDDDTDLGSTVRLSPDENQTAFNKVIAKLLTKKLNELKQTKNVTSSIDNLKTVKLNALELIKLNFIKENYLSGYINLWYMKMLDTGKSRVFLTFSMSPPVEGAINLKMMSRSSESDPPNIVQEIISKDKVFDSNDFAILYCDGKNWEIHGSVNFAMGKTYSEIEGNNKVQVFHLTKKVFPELEMLHDIKQKNDKNKVLKWWVMHMMQDYTDIIVRCGEKVGRISRSIIIKTWRTKVPSFIEFKGLDNVRPIGVGVNPRLWPYFLIGPYHMGDHHNLTLKLNSKIVPFEYYLPLDRVKPAFLLKRFVSSVIMHSWRNCRQVVGMWLYDRIGMKQSSFIQVRTKIKKSGSYEPSIEHDYSICKTPDGIFESKADRKDYSLPSKRFPDRNDTQPTQEVFLVPDVPNLGYIKGELHPDQSITIQHPLKLDRKRNSHRIGDWLNRIMRKRIKFYPNDFHVKWKVVKNAELVRNLQPFDRTSMGGTHILCRKGIFYLLSLTKEKITKLELDESVVMDAIINNPIIQEVVEVKELGKMLLKKDSCDLPMSDVLQMALYEIENLEKEDKSLRKTRVFVEGQRASLCRKLLKALDGCQIDEKSKRTINFYVTGILEGDKNRLDTIPNPTREKENCRRLEAINKFLQNMQFITSQKKSELSESCLNSKKEVEDAAEENTSRENTSEDKTEGSAVEENKLETDNVKVRELESKIKALHESLNKMSGNDENLRQMLTGRLNAMSQHLEKVKGSHNTNGKFSPVLERKDWSATERCDSPRLDVPAMKDTKIIKSDTVEFDGHSPDSVNCLDKDGSLINEKSNNDEENNNESNQVLKNNTDSLVPATEKVVSPNPSVLTKREKEPTVENPVNVLNNDGKIRANFEGKVIQEITLDEPEANSDTTNSKSNGFEILPAPAEGNRQQALKKDELKVDEKSQGNRVVFLDEMSLKTLRYSFKRREEKNCGHIGKRIRLKLLKTNSLANENGSEKLNGRVEYLEGKRVLFVSRKRKRSGRSDFLKKLRTNQCGSHCSAHTIEMADHELMQGGEKLTSLRRPRKVNGHGDHKKGPIQLRDPSLKYCWEWKTE